MQKKINWHKLRFLQVASGLGSCPDNKVPEIVLSGRSNAGKSSLVNALAGNKKLAKISQTPGKTQLLVYFLCENFYITDLPGYGYSASGKEKGEKFRKLADNYFTNSSDRNIKLVLLLLDCRHLPSKDDILMHEFLQAMDLPYIIILNKIDKISKQELRKQKQIILKALRLGPKAPCLGISSYRNIGIKELKETINQVLAVDEVTEKIQKEKDYHEVG